APWLIAGVFFGSAFWWLVLSQGVNLLGRKMNLNQLSWINQVSGLVIAGFGLVALGSLLWQ
ncbi:MAG TPA: LysE family translocator, partial [bacterium]|nr:LysE family translocator [bacterium]